MKTFLVIHYGDRYQHALVIHGDAARIDLKSHHHRPKYNHGSGSLIRHGNSGYPFPCIRVDNASRGRLYESSLAQSLHLTAAHDAAYSRARYAQYDKSHFLLRESNYMKYSNHEGWKPVASLGPRCY